MEKIISEYLWLIVIIICFLCLWWWADPAMIRYHRNAKKLLLTRAPSLLKKVWGLKEILMHEGPIPENRVREIQLKIKQRVEDLAVFHDSVHGKVCGEPVVVRVAYPNKLYIQVRQQKTKKAIKEAYRVLMKNHSRNKVMLYPLVLRIKTL